MSALQDAFVPPGPSDDDPVRQQIIGAAVEQFQLLGLRRTTVGDVARRARVGRVTVYRRVGDKRELVVAAIQAEVWRVIGTVNAAIAPLEDPEERLVEAFAVGVEAVRSHPLLRRLLETEPEDLLPYLTIEFGPILELASRFVAEQINDSSGSTDPELLGELLARLAQSLVLTPGGQVPQRDGRRLREFARSYLAPLLRI